MLNPSELNEDALRIVGMRNCYKTPHPERPISSFGIKIAGILGRVYSGIYHLPSKSLMRVDWSRSDYIELIVYGELATFDSSMLTHLVVLCHDNAVRLSVAAASPNHLRLLFHPRLPPGEGDMIETVHPTMEQAIKMIRGEAYFRDLIPEKKKIVRKSKG